MIKDIFKKNSLFLPSVLAIVLVIPAFFINLGITPIIEDEAIRGLVTLEMQLSGNYITPTIGGSLYYNKPPLFNWIMMPFFSIGGTNELMLRMATVISLLLFSLTIFVMVRKHLGDRVAITTALLFLTCGRIITYESLKGLIDILFSWVLFANFMILYNGISKNKLLSTFLKSYLLLFLAFMFKGLPAIIFQAITVLSISFIFCQWKAFRMLFSMKHLAGFFLFLALIALYYSIYFQNNPGTLNEMFTTMFDQSARRTAVRFGAGTFLIHLFTYPFEFAGHFLPWTLLLVLLLFKKIRRLLNHNFLKTTLWVFILNIAVYWTSPQSYARYVIMLIPLLYLVLAYLFEQEAVPRVNRAFYITFLTLLVLLVIVTIAIPFLPATAHRPYLFYKVAFLLLVQSGIVILYLNNHRNLLINTALFLLVVRIGFDWFVLTHRVENMKESPKREAARKIGRFAQNHQVYVYGKPSKYFDEDNLQAKYISFFTRFYISSTAGKIIYDTDTIKYDCYYLVRKEDVVGKNYNDYSNLGTTLDKVPRFLVQFKQ